MNSLGRPKKQNLEQTKYIDHTCHNTQRDSTSDMYVIKTSRFDSGMPCEPSPEGTSRTECHYWSTHIRMHGTGAER